MRFLWHFACQVERDRETERERARERQLSFCSWPSCPSVLIPLTILKRAKNPMKLAELKLRIVSKVFRLPMLWQSPKKKTLQLSETGSRETHRRKQCGKRAPKSCQFCVANGKWNMWQFAIRFISRVYIFINFTFVCWLDNCYGINSKYFQSESNGIWLLCRVQRAWQQVDISCTMPIPGTGQKH